MSYSLIRSSDQYARLGWCDVLWCLSRKLAVIKPTSSPGSCPQRFSKWRGEDPEDEAGLFHYFCYERSLKSVGLYATKVPNFRAYGNRKISSKKKQFKRRWTTKSPISGLYKRSIYMWFQESWTRPRSSNTAIRAQLFCLQDRFYERPIADLGEGCPLPPPCLLKHILRHRAPQIYPLSETGNVH